MHRVFQGIDHVSSLSRSADPAAANLAGMGIDDERQPTINAKRGTALPCEAIAVIAGTRPCLLENCAGEAEAVAS